MESDGGKTHRLVVCVLAHPAQKMAAVGEAERQHEGGSVDETHVCV